MQGIEYRSTKLKEWLESDDYIVFRHNVMNCYDTPEELFGMAIGYAFERGFEIGKENNANVEM